MGMRNVRLPQLQGVAPNSKASVQLPLGVTYEKLYFFLGTNILTSLITNIVLRINNKEFIRWATAADLISGLHLFKGGFNDTGTLILDFTELNAREEVAQKLGTIAATLEAGVQSVSLEFDLGNYTAVAASTITGYADVEAPSANSIIQRVQYSQKIFAAAGQDQIYVPYGRNGYQLKRLILKHAQLSSVRVRRDGVDVYEDLPVAMANKRLQDFKRTPQAGYHVIDFMPDVLQSNALNTAFIQGGNGQAVEVSNLDIRLTVAAADTVTIYTESYSLNSQL